MNRSIAKGPGDPLPGERACHGRHAPGFRAKQDSDSEERLGPVPKRGEDSDAQRRSAGRRAPVLQAQHDCAAAAGFHGVSQQQTLSTRLDRSSFEKHLPVVGGIRRAGLGLSLLSVHLYLVQ